MPYTVGLAVFLVPAGVGFAVPVELAGAGSVAAGAPVQEPPGDSKPGALSLRDALARTVESNPEYRKALNRMELEGPTVRAAWGAFLPELEVSYGTGQAFARERSWIDFDGTRIENPEIRTRVTSYANQVASLSVDLFRGGGRFHALEQARATARVSRLSGAEELNRILADVQRQFLLAQRDKAGLAVEETLLAERRRDFERSRRLFELDLITRSDLLGAELELEAQRSVVVEARGSLDKSLLALWRSIGDPSIEVLDVERHLPEPFDPAGIDVERLVERALDEGAVAGVAEATVAVNRAALKARRASRWPGLTLFSNLNRRAYETDRAALFDLNPGGFNGGVGFSVSIPLFDRFGTSRGISEAAVELRNANETVRQTAVELEERIRARYVDLGTAWEVLRERSRRREIAAERLDIVRREYELDTKTIEDLRAAIREDAIALRDEVNQRYEFASALVGLHETAGIVACEAGLDGCREAG